MLLPVGDHDDVLTEAVPDQMGLVPPAPEGDPHLLAAVHAKVLLSVLGQLKVGVLVLPLPLQAGDHELSHLVHPVVAQLPVAVVKGHQIVVLAVPDQAVGGDHIPLPLLTKDLLPGDVVVKIFEGDDPLSGDGGVELVHIVVDALVHHLDAARDVDLPLELARLMDAGQPLQLADEGVALLLGDEPGGLHRVHEQLHLGQFKLPGPDKPAGGLALPALDIQPEQAQGLHVVIDAFPFGPDVIPGQTLDDLRYREGVLLVALPQQHPGQMEQLRLLIGAFCHRVFLLSRSHAPV